MSPATGNGWEAPFPAVVRACGWLGLLGLTVFALSVAAVHLASPGGDWSRQYVSELANRRLGWVFRIGTFVHGWGNLALAVGLRGALRPGSSRVWGTLLFGLAAVGILLVGIFPTDSPDAAASIAGALHRSAASISFALELAALFVFSHAFGRQRRWRRCRRASLVLSGLAAASVTVFLVAVQLDMAPGLAERAALLLFLGWEIWIALLLVRPSRQPDRSGTAANIPSTGRPGPAG